MKKLIATILFVFVLSVMSCTNTNASSENLNIGVTDEEYCSKLKDWGAADVYIDRENSVLMYGVTTGQITGNPNDVAKLWFEDAYGSGIRGIKECRVIELPNFKTLGRYKSE